MCVLCARILTHATEADHSGTAHRISLFLLLSTALEQTVFQRDSAQGIGFKVLYNFSVDGVRSVRLSVSSGEKSLSHSLRRPVNRAAL
jgi:hypothetical protein